VQRLVFISIGLLCSLGSTLAGPPPLGFYIAYREPALGLHKVECSDFSAAGYIREKPDFPITRLEDIRIEFYPHQRNPAKLVFRFTPEDAKAFAAFTERQGEVRLFLMFGSEPLAEYGVLLRVLTRELLVGLPPSSDPQKLKQQLQVFVVKPDET
jgi:hypothetical protein